jgi:hypothetical protein
MTDTNSQKPANPSRRKFIRVLGLGGIIIGASALGAGTWLTTRDPADARGLGWTLDKTFQALAMMSAHARCPMQSWPPTRITGSPGWWTYPSPAPLCFTAILIDGCLKQTLLTGR